MPKEQRQLNEKDIEVSADLFNYITAISQDNQKLSTFCDMEKQVASAFLNKYIEKTGIDYLRLNNDLLFDLISTVLKILKPSFDLAEAGVGTSHEEREDISDEIYRYLEHTPTYIEAHRLGHAMLAPEQEILSREELESAGDTHDKIIKLFPNQETLAVVFGHNMKVHIIAALINKHTTSIDKLFLFENKELFKLLVMKTRAILLPIFDSRNPISSDSMEMESIKHGLCEYLTNTPVHIKAYRLTFAMKHFFPDLCDELFLQEGQLEELATTIVNRIGIPRADLLLLSDTLFKKHLGPLLSSPLLFEEGELLPSDLDSLSNMIDESLLPLSTIIQNCSRFLRHENEPQLSDINEHSDEYIHVWPTITSMGEEWFFKIKDPGSQLITRGRFSQFCASDSTYSIDQFAQQADDNHMAISKDPAHETRGVMPLWPAIYELIKQANNIDLYISDSEEEEEDDSLFYFLESEEEEEKEEKHGNKAIGILEDLITRLEPATQRQIPVDTLFGSSTDLSGDGNRKKQEKEADPQLSNLSLDGTS